jgi:hypothetical protein
MLPVRYGWSRLGLANNHGEWYVNTFFNIVETKHLRYSNILYI